MLTAIEKAGPEALKHSELLEPKTLSLRWGITGPPGAGKSTLIGQLIQGFRKKGLRVGVMAVDPSSPFTQGAILGDRIRYMDHALDEEVFVRSLGSRGSLGGLSSAAYLMLRAYDLMEFDIVLIETVGVGQTELEIMNVADHVAVVLVPESGDSIQTMKAGLMEIADIFVVNKSDRPGADGLSRELNALGEQQVLKTVATESQGVDELMGEMEQHSKDKKYLQVQRNQPQRLQWEARALLRDRWERELHPIISRIKTQKDLLKCLFQ